MIVFRLETQPSELGDLGQEGSVTLPESSLTSCWEFTLRLGVKRLVFMGRGSGNTPA